MRLVKTLKATLVWLGVLAWCAAPVAGYFYLTHQAQAATFTTSAVADGVVQAASGTSQRDAQLNLTWRSPEPIVAPAWDGLVQEIGLKSNQPLASGDSVALVDGIDRTACASTRPMAEDVQSGSKGVDVTTLQECLTLMGYDVSTDKGSYGRATRQAVTELAKQTGADSAEGPLIPTVPGAETDPATPPRRLSVGYWFAADWLVYLPEEGYVATAVDLRVGSPAPAAGSVLAAAQPVLMAATLTAAPATGAEIGVGDPPGDETAGQEGQGDSGGDGGVDGGTGGVGDGSENGTAVGAELVAAEDETLLVASVPVPLAEDRGKVSAEGLIALRALVNELAPSVPAKLERPSRVDELSVPASALVTALDGRRCVLVVESGRLRPVEVETVGDSDGWVMVRGELRAGQAARLSPGAEDRQCG
ncbi:MAG: hypothetical protein LBJ62_09830 [Bifidobacteriaceae bacterium]|jgi:hypothetical protein|nr:hypothetical protein [Bifidobacteriaceae bacterium]